YHYVPHSPGRNNLVRPVNRYDSRPAIVEDLRRMREDLTAMRAVRLPRGGGTRGPIFVCLPKRADAQQLIPRTAVRRRAQRRVLVSRAKDAATKHPRRPGSWQAD